MAGGGPKKPAIPATETDFDLVVVGGLNATALLKFLQAGEARYKMAIVTDSSKFVLPETYFTCMHEHIPLLKLESATVTAQVEAWSRANVGSRVTEYKPHENKLVLSNGQTYSYKALVLNPGFDHKSANLSGLLDFENEDRGENRVWGHVIDSKQRVVRNRYHGWNHPAGDMICYSPAHPYKGEGTDFYAFYYEHFLRQDQLQGRSSRSAKIQYWSPNKVISKFPYMNEVMLDECHKRGIEVHLGWELQKIAYNTIGEKIATFKCVDSGKIIEKPFISANINPPSRPHAELVSSGIASADGTIDVNKYTLQSKKFENIFAFGDVVGFDTTRTQQGAVAQNPVVKHNVSQFLDGKELNAIYDGYQYMPLYLGHSYGTSFAHTHDFEPAPMNHWVPHYGVFSNAWFKRFTKDSQKAADKYTSFKKNDGPPHYNFKARYVPLQHNEYLQSKGVRPEEVKMFEPKVRVHDHHDDHHAHH